MFFTFLHNAADETLRHTGRVAPYQAPFSQRNGTGAFIRLTWPTWAYVDLRGLTWLTWTYVANVAYVAYETYVDLRGAVLCVQALHCSMPIADHARFRGICTVAKAS